MGGELLVELLSSGRFTTTRIAVNNTKMTALMVPALHAKACSRRARLPVGSKKMGLPSMGVRTVRVSAIRSAPPATRIYALRPFVFQRQNAASLAARAPIEV